MSKQEEVGEGIQFRQAYRSALSSILPLCELFAPNEALKSSESCLTDVCFCGWLPKCLLSWGVAYSPASASPGLPSLFWGVACSQASTSLGLPSSSILQIHLSKVQDQLDCSELFAWCTVAFKIKYKLISLLFDILPSLLSISKCVWVSVSASGEKKLHLEVSAPATGVSPLSCLQLLMQTISLPVPTADLPWLTMRLYVRNPL